MFIKRIIISPEWQKKKILMFDQKHNKIKLPGLWKDFWEEKALSYIISGDIN